jgi:hypothetical protein
VPGKEKPGAVGERANEYRKENGKEILNTELFFPWVNFSRSLADKDIGYLWIDGGVAAKIYGNTGSQRKGKNRRGLLF